MYSNVDNAIYNVMVPLSFLPQQWHYSSMYLIFLTSGMYCKTPVTLRHMGTCLLTKSSNSWDGKYRFGWSSNGPDNLVLSSYSHIVVISEAASLISCWQSPKIECLTRANDTVTSVRKITV